MKRILLIEDEKGIANIERDYLELEGFEVTIENNGKSGLQRAESENFDLIVLDLMLPDIDGYEICRRLRKTTDIPILMVTARIEKIDKLRGLGLGADDYITKPFDPAELVARIKMHLSRYERIKGNNAENGVDIVYRDLRIQPLSRRVFFKGEEVILTAREFDLLYFLASNYNRVFTRDQLLDKVWGFDYLGDSRTVDVHVKRLREKLEGVSDKWVLKTVWGVGYKFELLN